MSILHESMLGHTSYVDIENNSPKRLYLCRLRLTNRLFDDLFNLVYSFIYSLTQILLCVLFAISHLYITK